MVKNNSVYFSYQEFLRRQIQPVANFRIETFLWEKEHVVLLVNILSVGLQAEGARVGLTGVGGDQARTDLVSRASCDRQPPLPAGRPQLPVSQSGWVFYF